MSREKNYNLGSAGPWDHTEQGFFFRQQERIWCHEGRDKSLLNGKENLNGEGELK